MMRFLKGNRLKTGALSLLLALTLLLSSCLVVERPYYVTLENGEVTGSVTVIPTEGDGTTDEAPRDPDEPLNIPAYSGSPYVAVNGNKPTFTAEEITTKAYETYHPLDSLGRCTYVEACLGKELMPTGDRGNISSVKPTGWHGGVTYPGINTDSLYNRCHLIAWSLSGENANRENLVTGTRYMNESGMLPFENMVLDYIRETGNHVMYRVTPVFEGDNLLCHGVLMEAYSVEDSGDGICFYVYCYNVQPGVILDYATGDSRLDDSLTGETDALPSNVTYIINKKSKVYHGLDSKYYNNLTSNMEYTTLSKSQLEAMGYKSCGTCKP